MPSIPTLAQVIAAGNVIAPNGQQQSIVWKDAAGKVRSELSFTPDPAVTIATYDADGAQKSSMQAGGDGSVSLVANGIGVITLTPDGTISVSPFAPDKPLVIAFQEADPHVANAVWNDAGTLKVSAG